MTDADVILAVIVVLALCVGIAVLSEIAIACLAASPEDDEERWREK